jgi:hypothetical protein
MNLAQAAIRLQKFFITFKISSFACMAWGLPGKISCAASQYVPFNCSLNVCPSDTWIHTPEKGDAPLIVVSDAHVHCHLCEPISGISVSCFFSQGKGFLTRGRSVACMVWELPGRFSCTAGQLMHVHPRPVRPCTRARAHTHTHTQGADCDLCCF